MKTNQSLFILFINVEYQILLVVQCLCIIELSLKVVILTQNFKDYIFFHQ